MDDAPTRVLLVEDNLGDARLIREALREDVGSASAAGRFDLIVATRLEHGLAQLQQSDIDVVLLDLSLPDADGLETFERVHAVAPTTPIVVLTGLDDSALAVRAMRSGAQDYIVKGAVDGPLLVRSIQYAMARKAAEMQHAELQREQAARKEAEAAQRRLALLTQASSDFASSLEYDETLRCIGTVVVPRIADGCVVYVVDEETRSLRAAASSWRDEVHANTRDEAADVTPVPLLATEHPVVSALSRSKPTLLSSVDQQMLAEIGASQIDVETLRSSAPTSIILAPLVAHGRALGVVLLVTAGARHFSERDIPFVDDLICRAALSLDNARLYRDAQNAIRARDEFLSIASHELRTPVTGLKAGAQLLLRLRTLGQLDEERSTRALDIVNTMCDRLSALTDDLLDVSRIRTGALPIRPAPVDLGALVRSIVDEFRARSTDSHELRLNTPAAPLMVMADSDRIGQVLINLLDNAIKYSPGGRVVEIEVRGDRAGAHVCVQDRGIGLPADAVDMIFEPFGRAPNAARKNLPGMGLGLHICRSIVERHGGRIWAESAGEDRGTRMCIWLPSMPDELTRPA